MRELTEAQWHSEAVRRFGVNIEQWRFVCPACGHVASVSDWRAAGASHGEIAFSCIGRRSKEIGCSYAGGGLFKLNPVSVHHAEGVSRLFEFEGYVADERESKWVK